MIKLTFSSVNLGKLTINGVFALCDSTVNLANPVKDEISQIPAAALTQLDSDTQNLGKQINKNQKSEITAEMKGFDKERDQNAGEIYREVVTAAKSSDPDKKAAANTLQPFLLPYHGLAKKPLDIQTAITTEMLVKYNASAVLKAAAIKLGIDGLFTLMGNNNTAFDILYKDRITESSEKEVSGTSLRPAATKSYTQFCVAIEQAAKFTPSPAITALFNKMDELRKKYHALESAARDKTVEE